MLVRLASPLFNDGERWDTFATPGTGIGSGAALRHVPFATFDANLPLRRHQETDLKARGADVIGEGISWNLEDGVFGLPSPPPDGGAVPVEIQFSDVKLESVRR